MYDSGNFKIGDTLTEGENMIYRGIPSFSPEIFKELINADPLKTKQLEKGIRQLTDEGVAQLFLMQPGNRKVIGTVGELQFEVIQYRLEHEYGAKCRFESLSFYKALWITTDNKAKVEEFRWICSGLEEADTFGRIRTVYPPQENYWEQLNGAALEESGLYRYAISVLGD